jgi:hypothetical protein
MIGRTWLAPTPFTSMPGSAMRSSATLSTGTSSTSSITETDCGMANASTSLKVAVTVVSKNTDGSFDLGSSDSSSASSSSASVSSFSADSGGAVLALDEEVAEDVVELACAPSGAARTCKTSRLPSQASPAKKPWNLRAL